jgi:2-phospho-L-lactate guanylyltransferase
MTRTAAILPVKRFDRAKQRLAERLEPGGRRALAEAMVGDVLDVLARVDAIDAIVVVTAEPRARELAAAAGASCVDDEREEGQSAAATLGLRRARELGASRAILVPGDCPAMDVAELGELLGSAPTPPGIVVVPDRHGSGTNALVLDPLDAIAPSFGPGSRARHEALAQGAGVAWRVDVVPGLALDVDTGDDLAALRAALGPDTARAPRFRAALDALEREPAAPLP